jgi:hypothetical protein
MIDFNREKIILKNFSIMLLYLVIHIFDWFSFRSIEFHNQSFLLRNGVLMLMALFNLI